MDDPASELRLHVDPTDTKLRSLVSVAVGGAIGTLARYGLHVWLGNNSDWAFRWDTLAANFGGCMIAGLIVAADEGGRRLGVLGGLAVRVGFLASFTSFSAFAFGTVQLAREERWLVAMGNVTLANSLMVAAVMIGLTAGTYIRKKILSSGGEPQGYSLRGD